MTASRTLQRAVNVATEQTMIAQEREQFLHRLALFSDLETDQLRALAEVAQVVQFPASALIFREGEAGDCAYIVVRGSVEVFAIDRNGDEIVLAQLKELDHVGEQSLLPATPAVATRAFAPVRTARSSESPRRN